MNVDEAERISRVKKKAKDVVDKSDLKMEVVDVEDNYYVMSVENVKGFYPNSGRLSPVNLSDLLLKEGVFDCYTAKDGKFIILVNYENFLD